MNKLRDDKEETVVKQNEANRGSSDTITVSSKSEEKFPCLASDWR